MKHFNTFKQIILLIFPLLLLTLSCNNTSPKTGQSELTVHLSTSNNADVIEGEFFLQRNSGKSRVYRSFAIENVVSFTEIETGNYSLMLNSQKIEDNISISEHTHNHFINLEKTELKEIMEKARQTYLDTVIREYYPGATIDLVSFKPFIGIFNGSLVAVFHGVDSPRDRNIVIDSKIGNLTFYWPHKYSIRVWNDDTIYELFEAYELDLLTDENLSSIYNSHWKHFGNENWWIDKSLLNAEMERRLLYDYMDFAPSIRREERFVVTISINKYYGIFNNCYVLALCSGSWLLIDVFGIEETVAGRYFGYPYIGNEILVWNEGDFYRLGQAYEENLLTDDSIEAIWHQFQEHFGWNKDE